MHVNIYNQQFNMVNYSHPLHVVLRAINSFVYELFIKKLLRIQFIINENIHNSLYRKLHEMFNLFISYLRNQINSAYLYVSYHFKFPNLRNDKKVPIIIDVHDTSY